MSYPIVQEAPGLRGQLHFRQHLIDVHAGQGHHPRLELAPAVRLSVQPLARIDHRAADADGGFQVVSRSTSISKQRTPPPRMGNHLTAIAVAA